MEAKVRCRSTKDTGDLIQVGGFLWYLVPLCAGRHQRQLGGLAE